MAEIETEGDLIPCPYCGRMTSAEANFCYYCARELKARPERPAETSSSSFKVTWAFAAVVIILALAIIVILALRT